MIKVTLDHNCIIALENNEASAPYIKELINMNDKNKIILQVVSIGAAERLPDGRHISNITEFKERIVVVGLGHVTILKPIAYWGLSFWGWGLNSDGPNGSMKTLEREIHKILFPEIEFEYVDFCKARNLNPRSKEIDGKWRNRKCDVLTLWSHMYHKGDIFVSSEKGINKRKQALIQLGVGDILTPQVAVSKLCSMGITSKRILL